MSQDDEEFELSSDENDQFSNDLTGEEDDLMLANYGLIKYYESDIPRTNSLVDRGVANPAQSSFIMDDDAIVHFVVRHNSRRRNALISAESRCNCLLKHVSGANYKTLCELIQNAQRYVSANSSSEVSRFDVIRTMLSSMRKSENHSQKHPSKVFYDYYIGGGFCLGNDHRDLRVCVDAFRLIFRLSARQLGNLQSEIKHGVFKERDVDFDKLSVPASIRRKLSKSGRSTNDGDTIFVRDSEDGKLKPLKLTRNQILLMSYPNSATQKTTVTWMSDYFELVGDYSPNSDCVELEPQFKTCIYDEYCSYMRDVALEAPVAKSLFYKLWRDLFPDVKIRQYKSVTGKCTHCAYLADLRTRSKNVVSRALVSELHAYHKITYMGERQTYYDRRNSAHNNPNQYMSIILDGMAAQHTELPYLANMKKFPAQISLHLQGVIEHGQCFTIYRTFGNVLSDSNLAIHCLLLSLQRRIDRCGRLPPTVYIQIDGGSENTNKWLIAMCEMLIARRLTTRIYLTRLPVGHTHEDIDSKFGNLWTNANQKFIVTPQGQSRVIKEVFDGNEREPFFLEDLFVVGDYQALFKDCIDPHFRNYSKEENTQLSWCFELVERCKEFPLGVKTTYRAYTKDEVFELVPDSSDDTQGSGYAVARTHCRWHPMQTTDTGNRIQGMSILLEMPSTKLKPAAFADGYLSEISKVMDAVSRSFGRDSINVTNYLEEWTSFRQLYPSSMDPMQYLHYFKTPLENDLFGYLNIAAVPAERSPPTMSAFYRNHTRSIQEQLKGSNVKVNDHAAPSAVHWRDVVATQQYVSSRVQVEPGSTVDQTFDDASNISTRQLCQATNNKLRTLTKRQLEVICNHMGIAKVAKYKKEDLIQRIIAVRSGSGMQQNAPIAESTDAEA